MRRLFFSPPAARKRRVEGGERTVQGFAISLSIVIASASEAIHRVTKRKNGLLRRKGSSQ
jgi:hypothetical protein